nr:HD domain-containing protein [uncultured Oscillibacter sp.]
MTTAEIARKMTADSNGNRHDVNHFMKVYAFAKIIGECEGLDPAAQNILEIAAIVHDIACPLCREKYGNTNGKYQELEGPALVRDFLADSGLPQEAVDRIAWLVGHHHTLRDIGGPDHQILIEADYLVNADESGYSRENVENTLERVFRTETGKALLRAMYL